MGRGGINKFGLPIPCRGSEGCNYLLKMWLVNYSKLINTYPTSVLSLSVLFFKKNFSFSVPKMDGQTERNAHFWFQMPCLLYRWCAAWLGVYIYLLFSFLLGTKLGIYLRGGTYLLRWRTSTKSLGHNIYCRSNCTSLPSALSIMCVNKHLYYY